MILKSSNINLKNEFHHKKHVMPYFSSIILKKKKSTDLGKVGDFTNFPN